MNIRILLVEDDRDLGYLLAQYLQISGFAPTQVYNGIEARQALEKEDFDIAVIDVMMPQEDGFALAEKLVLSHPQLPFLFVTARSLKEDVLKGLKLGADDYIIKPFDADELIQRIHNILKRTGYALETVPSENTIAIGLYTFDPQNLELKDSNSTDMLTEKEAALLYYLYINRNKVVRRKVILTLLWKQDDFFSGRSMDVFITRLRKRLAGDKTISIESIRGIGFRFSCC